MLTTLHKAPDLVEQRQFVCQDRCLVWHPLINWPEAVGPFYPALFVNAFCAYKQHLQINAVLSNSAYSLWNIEWDTCCLGQPELYSMCLSHMSEVKKSSNFGLLKEAGVIFFTLRNTSQPQLFLCSCLLTFLAFTTFFKVTSLDLNQAPWNNAADCYQSNGSVWLLD